LQRVLKGLEQFDNGGGSVRLRLHPPELGSLQITLRVEAQQVSALVEVEHSAARDVLLSNLPQLQSRLAEQGLNVSQFDVQVVDSNQWSQGSSQGWEAGNGQGTNQNDSESKRSSRYSDRLQNQLERAPTADMNPSGQPLWTRKNGQIDVRV
jgi:flagellar hook-length control protein FliK